MDLIALSQTGNAVVTLIVVLLMFVLFYFVWKLTYSSFESLASFCNEKRLSDVGFEPTPSFEDQNTLFGLCISSQGITLSLAP